MLSKNSSIHQNTPSVSILDNRGLTVRDIAWYRHPGSPDVTAVRLIRHRYDARGYLTQSSDPRLHDAGLVNFLYITDLAGGVLRAQGVDNDTSITLNDVAGRPVITVSAIRTIDGSSMDQSQALTRMWQYEGNVMPGRPLSVTEHVTSGTTRICERFVWAGNGDAEKAQNLAGQCISHYDTAGLAQTSSVALTGVPLTVSRRLLKGADNPDVVADWQGGDISAWNDLLETTTYSSQSTSDATGAMMTSIDAKGNQQRMAYDVAGLLCGSWLTVKDGAEQTIVRSLTYSAAGQKLREEHGNGVVTTYIYEPTTQRLSGIKTERPAGHVAGAKVLQDLRYEYDPAGNVLRFRNDAEVTRFWRNQKVMPENVYTYDSLYQLVSVTGREMANAGQQGSALPPLTVPLPNDNTVYTNYTRTYTYDSAGNLTQISHSAPATNNNYTTNITVSDRSNRGVLSSLTENPADVEALFTAGGQQMQLQPGQTLAWTPRGELLKVSPVAREGAASDMESYRYGADSQRLLKVSEQLTGGSVQTKRALYLPGLEHRTTLSGGTETEILQVITVGEAGQAQVRVLHWESGAPEGISSDQVRYSHTNLTGSSQMELDGTGSVISMEEYYPYGGTAVWTARSAVEAGYKTVRYSGKERDVTGLDYYGYRYYQPWAGRWLCADPAGAVDGLNLYCMVSNNPVTYFDSNGLARDTLVIFTQPQETLKSKEGSFTIRYVAERMFSSNDEIKKRMLMPPVLYEEIGARLGDVPLKRQPLNLVLIGHGTIGYLRLGEDLSHDLNLLNIPSNITSRVENIFLLHCSSGQGIDDIGRKTIGGNKGSWGALKAVSGNLYQNTWDHTSGTILRRGWADTPDQERSAQWLTGTQNRIENMGDTDRSAEDSALKRSHPYFPKTVLTAEGYHLTYNVLEDSVSFSYPKAVRQSVAATATATATRRAKTATGSRATTARNRSVSASRRGPAMSQAPRSSRQNNERV